MADQFQPRQAPVAHPGSSLDSVISDRVQMLLGQQVVTILRLQSQLEQAEARGKELSQQLSRALMKTDVAEFAPVSDAQRGGF